MEVFGSSSPLSKYSICWTIVVITFFLDFTWWWWLPFFFSSGFSSWAFFVPWDLESVFFCFFFYLVALLSFLLSDVLPWISTAANFAYYALISKYISRSWSSSRVSAISLIWGGKEISKTFLISLMSVSSGVSAEKLLDKAAAGFWGTLKSA